MSWLVWMFEYIWISGCYLSGPGTYVCYLKLMSGGYTLGLNYVWSRILSIWTRPTLSDTESDLSGTDDSLSEWCLNKCLDQNAPGSGCRHPNIWSSVWLRHRCLPPECGASRCQTFLSGVRSVRSGWSRQSRGFPYLVMMAVSHTLGTELNPPGAFKDFFVFFWLIIWSQAMDKK